jgi:GNAT superfamily N-acetyltransferase
LRHESLVPNLNRDHLQIRDGRRDEAAAFMEIQRAASLVAFAHIYPRERYPFPDESVREQWEKLLGDNVVRVLVAEHESTTLGVIAFSSEQLHQLWVLPTEWGSGVAIRLYLAALEIRGVDRYPWQLWVLEQNPRARRFYERQGWRLDGRQMETRFPPHPVLLGYTLQEHVPTGATR